MSNEKTVSANAAEFPLWRVSYSYAVAERLRQSTYILSAPNDKAAIEKAKALLSARFETACWRVTSARPF